MLAVHLENGSVSVRERPRPRRAEGFALIRLLYAGICNTDLELRRGYYRFRGTPGHEFVGEVAEADTRALVGARVVGEINIECGACEWCGRGLGRHCPRRAVLGIRKHPGAFREFLTLPERNLRVAPPSIRSEHAVFIEPLAAACEIFEQVSLPPGARVAVLGAGKLGLLIARALRAHGMEASTYGRRDQKPAAAYDWVVDATGSPAGLPAAVKMTRPRGTVIMKSTVHGLAGLDAAPVIVNELTLVGSRCGRFEPALKLLASGQVQVDDLISDALPLAEAPAAFARAAKKGVLKVLLRG